MASEKNLARYLSVNFVRLTREVLVELPRSGFDLHRTVARLRDSIWGDDLTHDEKRLRLFGPEEWDELPMAVLAARQLWLPVDKIPQTRQQLADLCRWLLSRDGSEVLVETFVRGWAGAETPFMALDSFVTQLWSVQESDRAFFDTLVRGQHAIALEMITMRRLSPALNDDQALHLLTRMTMVWAAFDCQATAARVRRSMRQPLGWLVRGSAARMTASTLATVFRPVTKALQKFLDGYRYDGQGAKKSPRSRISAVADIRDRATAKADRLGAEKGDAVLDVVVGQVAARSTEPSALFQQQVAKPQTDRAYGERQISQFWFANLLPLQILGLVAMRMAQLEQQLHAQLHDEVQRARAGNTKAVLLVPEFHDLPLRSGWRGRSRTIVDALRSAILQDPDHHSVRKSRAGTACSEDIMDGAAHDDRFILPVENFLAQTPRYVHVTEAEEWRKRRKTLEALDLAIGHRFRPTLSGFSVDVARDRAGAASSAR